MRKNSATLNQPASTTSMSQAKPTVPSEAAIRLYAYMMWEAAGKPESDGVPFWLEAEQEARNCR